MQRLTSLLLCGLIMSLLPGCAYNEYAEQSGKIGVAEADMRDWQTETIMEALESICGVFDGLAIQHIKADEASPMMTIVSTNFDGLPTTTTVYHPPADRAMAMIMAGVAKSMVIRELYPIVKELVRDLTTELKRPVTWQDVALRIADDTGLLATIGGMYGLGKSGIEAAQGVINANLSNGSTLAKDGSTAFGNYQPWTDNSTDSQTETITEQPAS